MIDVTHQISSVDRTVGARTLPAGEARVVTISQTYETTAADLWEACTTAERIGRWFLPVSGDLRPGGSYALEGNAHGTITSCDPPHRFEATWEYDGDVSWIEVRVEEVDAARARFVLEHVIPVDDERWAEYGPGAVGVGWDMGLLGLVLHVASGGAAVDREEVGGWLASEAGIGFVRALAGRWGDADAAAGTPEGHARTAAERTTAAYTGT